jgi:hypothetical protein
VTISTPFKLLVGVTSQTPSFKTSFTMVRSMILIAFVIYWGWGADVGGGKSDPYRISSRPSLSNIYRLLLRVFLTTLFAPSLFPIETPI